MFLQSLNNQQIKIIQILDDYESQKIKGNSQSSQILVNQQIGSAYWINRVFLNMNISIRYITYLLRIKKDSALTVIMRKPNVFHQTSQTKGTTNPHKSDTTPKKYDIVEIRNPFLREDFLRLPKAKSKVTINTNKNRRKLAEKENQLCSIPSNFSHWSGSSRSSIRSYERQWSFSMDKRLQKQFSIEKQRMKLFGPEIIRYKVNNSSVMKEYYNQNTDTNKQMRKKADQKAIQQYFFVANENSKMMSYQSRQSMIKEKKGQDKTEINHKRGLKVKKSLSWNIDENADQKKLKKSQQLFSDNMMRSEMKQSKEHTFGEIDLMASQDYNDEILEEFKESLGEQQRNALQYSSNQASNFKRFKGLCSSSWSSSGSSSSDFMKNRKQKLSSFNKASKTKKGNPHPSYLVLQDKKFYSINT